MDFYRIVDVSCSQPLLLLTTGLRSSWHEAEQALLTVRPSRNDLIV